MSRIWIVQGDTTSSGGKVIGGSPFTDIDGFPVARIGDQATYPTHKGVFPIIDGDPTTIIDGQPVALHRIRWHAAAKCSRCVRRMCFWMSGLPQQHHPFLQLQLQLQPSTPQAQEPCPRHSTRLSFSDRS